MGAMQDREAEILSQAITDTNKEIANAAWGDEEDIVQDETGDRSLEATGDGLEGQHEPEDAETESEEEEGEESEGEEGQDDKGKIAAKDADGKDAAGKPDATDAGADNAAQGDANGKVPSGRLREQTERAKALETERDTLKAELETLRTGSRKEVDELKARFDGVLQALQRQQPQPKAAEQAKAPDFPDPLEDPVGFRKAMNDQLEGRLAQVQNQIITDRIEDSMQAAADRHKETFTQAYDAVGKLNRNNPADQATVRAIWNARNPGEALVKWHRDQQTLREVGEDPAKYKERIASETREALMKDPEFRKQLIESLQADATGDDGRPMRTITRLPPNMSRAAGGNSTRGDADMVSNDGSPQAVADAAWR